MPRGIDHVREADVVAPKRGQGSCANGGYAMKRVEFKRILAGAIAVCMIAALMPETFLFARADGSGGETTVVGFEAAESSWAEQTVPSGLDQDALIGEGLLYLPSSLAALVLVPAEPQVEPGPGFDGPEIFDGSAGDTDAPAQPEDVPDTVVIAAQVPVTWPTACLYWSPSSPGDMSRERASACRL